MENDVEHLRHQGLIEQRSIEGHESYSKQLFALTKEGHNLLSRQNLIPDRQATYHGFVKAKEARHDADLYRLYHKVAKEIDRVGGKVRRVVLDYELKRELYRKLSQVDPNKKLAYERIRFASEYDLKVVNDKRRSASIWTQTDSNCQRFAD
jgi:hypothetical protein